MSKRQTKAPKVPVKELIDLFLWVADICDAEESPGTSNGLAAKKVAAYLRAPYSAVSKTAWGQKVYKDACIQANNRL